MRVAFYTRPALLDAALSLIEALAPAHDLHVFLEITPEAWQTSIFELDARQLGSGVVDGGRLIDSAPAAMRATLRNVASFQLVVHRQPRSLHPATWLTSYRAMRAIRAVRPDIVHFDDASLRLGMAVRGLRGTPVIFTVHDPEPHSGEDDWRARLAYWLTLGQATRFILHSSSLRAGFCARFGVAEDHVDVVHLGAYTVYRQTREAVPTAEIGDESHVLFFGRLSPYKGLEVLYAAAPAVAAQVPNFRLTVAGRPNPGYVPPTPPSLPNGGRIDVEDHYISNARLADLFERAAVVACPYLDATQSGVVMTAYAFDRPVVATTVGGLPEYVHDAQTGLLVAPRNADALAAALARVLLDRDLRARLVEGVRHARCTEFNWGRAAQETSAAYSRARAVPILRSPSHPASHHP